MVKINTKDGERYLKVWSENPVLYYSYTRKTAYKKYKAYCDLFVSGRSWVDKNGKPAHLFSLLEMKSFKEWADTEL